MPRRSPTGAAPGKPGKAMTLAMQAQVLQQYVGGMTREQIGVSLNLTDERVDRYLTNAMDALVRHWAKPTPEHTFVRYACFQMGVIEKLQRSYDKFMNEDENARQHSACISALKAQSDIMDKVLTKGQEFGIITREVADQTVQMSRTDLRTELRNEIELLAGLLAQVDNHETFKRRRAAALQKAGNKPRRYIARIRKVKRNSLGFVTALPDWKFKKQAHEEAGGIIPQHRAPASQRAALQQEETTTIELEVEPELLQQYNDRAPSPRPTIITRSSEKPPQSVLKAHQQQSSPPTSNKTNRAGYDEPTDLTLT